MRNEKVYVEFLKRVHSSKTKAELDQVLEDIRRTYPEGDPARADLGESIAMQRVAISPPPERERSQ